MGIGYLEGGRPAQGPERRRLGPGELDASFGADDDAEARDGCVRGSTDPVGENSGNTAMSHPCRRAASSTHKCCFRFAASSPFPELIAVKSARIDVL